MIGVACGEPVGCDRVVVDVVRREEIGDPCVGREHDGSGRVLANGEQREENGRAPCSGDGHVGLPEWDAEDIETACATTLSNEYEVTRATARRRDERIHDGSRDSDEITDSGRTAIGST